MALSAGDIANVVTAVATVVTAGIAVVVAAQRWRWKPPLIEADFHSGWDKIAHGSIIIQNQARERVTVEWIEIVEPSVVFFFDGQNQEPRLRVNVTLEGVNRTHPSTHQLDVHLKMPGPAQRLKIRFKARTGLGKDKVFQIKTPIRNAG